jgi:hypothetical protein
MKENRIIENIGIVIKRRGGCHVLKILSVRFASINLCPRKLFRRYFL